MILLIEPWLYWTFLALLVANLLAAIVKSWVVHRAPAKQYIRTEKPMPQECEGKDPYLCWNVRCQLGKECCRTYEVREVDGGNCVLCKGTGVADLPDPWGGVRGTCPDCHGTGNAPADPCPQCERGGTCNTAECGRKRSSELMRLYA